MYFLAIYKSGCSGLREGKGGALFGLAFFSQPKKAGAGDRPDRGTPKKMEKCGLFLVFL